MPATRDMLPRWTPGAMYADAIQLHFDTVDGKMYEFSFARLRSAQRFKSMIRPDGGIPDELRRQYTATRPRSPTRMARRRTTRCSLPRRWSAWPSWRGGAATPACTPISTRRLAAARSTGAPVLDRQQRELTSGSMLEIGKSILHLPEPASSGTRRKLADYQSLLSKDLPAPQAPGRLAGGRRVYELWDAGAWLRRGGDYSATAEGGGALIGVSFPFSSQVDLLVGRQSGACECRCARAILTPRRAHPSA